jgi:hypothetical protein
MTLRALQWPAAAETMRGFRMSELRGKVAIAAANVVEIGHGDVSPEGRDEFRSACNYLNRRGWLRPPLWDGAFAWRLAGLLPEPAFGHVAETAAAAGQVQLAGFAHPADAVVVAAGNTILGVFFPGPDGKWSGSVVTAAPLDAIRCFAYDALTGETHLLRPAFFASRNSS